MAIGALGWEQPLPILSVQEGDFLAHPRWNWGAMSREGTGIWKGAEEGAHLS